MAEYIPGVCNIGPQEIKNRRQIGITWIIGSLIFLALVFALKAPPFVRLLVILPLIVAASGFYQAFFHFCAGYGMSGLYNVSKSLGKSDTVEQAEFRKKDKQKAQQIFALSVVTAIVLGVISYFI